MKINLKKHLYKILFVTPLWLLLIHSIITNHIQNKPDIKKEILETRTYFDFKSMTRADEKYYGTAIEIMSAYSKMKRPERVTFIKENSRVADLVSRSRWDIFGIGILETSLNPRGKHDYGELGPLGIKYDTALFAEFIQRKFMPSHIASKMRINIKSRKDLLDIKTSIRIAYTLLWWFDQCYEGSDMWSVSVYHWGGFIAKHWKNDRIIPETFTLNDIKYGVKNYYLAWKELVTCFEKGQLEPIANIYARYQKKRAKLSKKEVTFRNAYKIIKGYEKRIKKYEEAEIEFKGTVKELKEYKKQAKKELLKVSNDAKKGKSKNMIPRIKQICREFYNKLSGGKK